MRLGLNKNQIKKIKIICLALQCNPTNKLFNGYFCKPKTYKLVFMDGIMFVYVFFYIVNILYYKRFRGLGNK